MSISVQLEPDRAHLAALVGALVALDDDLICIERLGERIADVLLRGGRLLTAGNGGSAAHAQHLTAELVGRYQDDRLPLSAIALHGDTSTLTAIANDYGLSECFARQVRAHGRPGDILVVLSTSGESQNVVAAVDAATAGGLFTIALTGPAPSTLSRSADQAVAVDAEMAATVQEVHQVVIHLLCESIERSLTGTRVVRTEELLP
jgi:phosphoheptose isomerase